MATSVYGFVQFSDGSFASLADNSVSEVTSSEIVTGGTGLNQVAGVSIGTAFEGKVAIAASLLVQTDTAVSGFFCNGYFLGPDGKIQSIVQGHGTRGTGSYRLLKPVRMQTGVKLMATWDANADAVALASQAVYCSDGTCDVFTCTAVDATKVSMTNKDGATIGEALAGKTIVQSYGTYSATNGLNDNGAGVSGFYIESADGQLKYVLSPQPGLYRLNWGMEGSLAVPISQNDTLSCMAGL